jgi:hypothetical protein
MLGVHGAGLAQLGLARNDGQARDAESRSRRGRATETGSPIAPSMSGISPASRECAIPSRACRAGQPSRSASTKTSRRATGASSAGVPIVASSQVRRSLCHPLERRVLTVDSTRNECDTPQAKATTAFRGCRRHADVE